MLDDAVVQVSATHHQEASGRVNPIAEWSFVGRSRGLGFVIVSHRYRSVSPTLRANCDTLVVHRVGGEDVSELARDMRLTREQAEMLTRLEVGQAVVLAKNVWPSPVLVRMPDISQVDTDIDETHREVIKTDFLKKVVSVRREFPVAPRPKPDELTEDAVGLLVRASQSPDRTLTQLYDGAGLSGEGGKRALQHLINRGLVKVLTVCKKGRGGHPRVLEITKDGMEELKKRGIAWPKKWVGRGSWKHSYIYPRWILQWAKSLGYRCEFEKWMGEKAFDVVYVDHNNDLVGIEIALTGTALHNAKEAVRGASIRGVKRVEVACESRGFCKAIMVEVSGMDVPEAVKRKIIGKHLADYKE